MLNSSRRPNLQQRIVLTPTLATEALLPPEVLARIEAANRDPSPGKAVLLIRPPDQPPGPVLDVDVKNVKSLPPEILALLDADAGKGLYRDADYVAIGRVLTVTTFENLHVTKQHQRRTSRLTLAQLREVVLETNKRKKGDCPLLKLAFFGDEWSPKHSLRWDKNVVFISGIELDYDLAMMPFEEALDRLRAAGLMALAYTSPSHSLEHIHKWRILCPTSKDLPPEKRLQLVKRINGLFDGGFSGETFSLSQPMFYGRVKSNPDHRAVIIDGDYIDLRNDLDEGALGKQIPGKKKTGDPKQTDDDLPHGFENILDGLGDGPGRNGFHDELIRAAASYVGEHGKDFNREEVKAQMRAAIERAPKHHDRYKADIPRYLSDRFLDDAIESAVAKYGDGGGKGKSKKKELHFVDLQHAPIYMSLEAARAAINQIGGEFLHLVTTGGIETGAGDWPFPTEGDVTMEEDDDDIDGVTAPTWAIRAGTAIGKTNIMCTLLSDWLRGTKRTVVYLVPTHELGDRIVTLFAERGISSKLFRGRDAPDPDNPKQEMCQDMIKVRLAQALREDVNKSCCKHGAHECYFYKYKKCSYQKQKEATPQVWVAANNVLFHANKIFGAPDLIIIDESFWQAGVRGVIPDDDEIGWFLPVGSLVTPTDYDNLDERIPNRNILAKLFQNQTGEDGFDATHFGDITIDLCTRALRQERTYARQLQAEAGLHPGMSNDALYKVTKNKDLIDAIQHTRRVATVWSEVRKMKRAKIKVSGRLLLKRQNGQTVITWRGVARIRQQFNVPTLLLDATLPSKEILKVYHPKVRLVADINVSLPEVVFVRQIKFSPTSVGKLKNPNHLAEVRRYILQRFIQVGKRSTLIITLKRFKEGLNLPPEIMLAHYNAIKGIDDWKDVSLLILVGRTTPGPDAEASFAGALTGAKPIEPVANGRRFVWYDTVIRHILLRDGRGVETENDEHPDPTGEAVRWQIHEAELVQAIGRARGINRTAATPLEIDILTDAALPVQVDLVEPWKRPSLLIETAFSDGVMIGSPGAMVKLWPALWPNRKAAQRTLEEDGPDLPGFGLRVEYQLAGNGMQRRVAYFDESRFSGAENALEWLRRKLGPLEAL